MLTIHKYVLNDRVNKIILPVGAEALCVQLQHERPTIWVLVDIDEPNVEERTFVVLATGEEIKFDHEFAKYVGTIQMSMGMFVWHIFDVS